MQCLINTVLGYVSYCDFVADTQPKETMDKEESFLHLCGVPVFTYATTLSLL